jgi:hypothetical protein
MSSLVIDHKQIFEANLDGTRTVVMDIFPPTEEIKLSKAEPLEFPLTCYPSYEVSLIRVYFWDGAWRFSTSNKLDAYEAKWASSTSFGEIFESTVTQLSGRDFTSFLDSLDKELKYFFLVPLTGQNRIGLMRDPLADLWLAAIEEAGAISYDVPEGMWRSLPTLTFNTLDELRQYISEGYERDPIVTGVVVYGEDKFVRILHDSYYDLAILRNNVPDVRRRFLELHNVPAKQKLFYQQHEKSLRPFPQLLDGLIRDLHSKYIDRYIHKRFLVLPKLEHAVLKKCHEMYLNGRELGKKDIITRRRLEAILFEFFKPQVILNMLG